MNFNVYKTILFRLSIIQGYWNQIYGHSEISGCVRHPGLIKQIFLLLEATTELYSLSLSELLISALLWQNSIYHYLN